MAHQAASAARTHAPQPTGPERRAAIDQLRRSLVAGRNADGGWGYYAGKTSRLEPTCWALLALQAATSQAPAVDPALAWLAERQRPIGWLVEDPAWPVNIAYNALAAFSLLHHRDRIALDVVRRLLASVVSSKGASAPPAADVRQDNSLQGWSWVDATFSWVEPTCWGLLALKKARAAGLSDSAAAPRIAEAERLLIDRSCQPGGWNFGNAAVLGQDLRPYVPTTALALLALQDRRSENVVVRGLSTLEARWPDEISATALGLSLVCLNVYDRPADRLVSQAIDHAAKALSFGNFHGNAVALFALSSFEKPHAFRL